MFLKQLQITGNNGIIREINFHIGLNLIVDESIEDITGNNVGKTTVLKLVDFCLGANHKNIYTDTETKNKEYKLIKDFLINEKVLITLVLTEDLNNKNSKEIKIERNFLSRNEKINNINGEEFNDSNFDKRLAQLIFPNLKSEKPTFRQCISHNIRYNDYNLNNTLKTLNYYTKDTEYETLYLFLFGLNYEDGEKRLEILTELAQEEKFKKRIENDNTINIYKSMLFLVENQINELNKKKSDLNLNENFENDLEKLNHIKYEINLLSSEINRLNLRKELINESEREFKNSISKIDVNKLHNIYNQATSYITNIQKTFDDLLEYHNKMAIEKIKFITKELPSLENNINEKKEKLNNLLENEKELSLVIAKSDTYEDLDRIINELNEKYRKKGELENIISQLTDINKRIEENLVNLKKIDNELFSEQFEQELIKKIKKINFYFSKFSKILYNEEFFVNYDVIVNKNIKTYKFNTFNSNLSSGKKQGEITSFDIAYILFAEDEKLPCIHFILTDKKELMHDNQLVNIKDIVEKNNIQFIAPILKDKLPRQLNNEKYFILKLSQEDKLFRVK